VLTARGKEVKLAFLVGRAGLHVVAVGEERVYSSGTVVAGTLNDWIDDHDGYRVALTRTIN